MLSRVFLSVRTSLLKGVIMTSGTTGSVTEMIASREREIAFLKALQAAEHDPVLRELALQSLGVEQSKGSRQRKASVKNGKPSTATAVDRIINFFKGTGNKLASISELSSAAKCSESSARQVLYRTHKEAFHKEQQADGRKMLFRLADHS